MLKSKQFKSSTKKGENKMSSFVSSVPRGNRFCKKSTTNHRRPKVSVKIIEDGRENPIAVIVEVLRPGNKAQKPKVGEKVHIPCKTRALIEENGYGPGSEMVVKLVPSNHGYKPAPWVATIFVDGDPHNKNVDSKKALEEILLVLGQLTEMCERHLRLLE